MTHDHDTDGSLGEAGARLRALVAKWRELAEKDYHTATDDISDGVWAYQHEASGRSRAWKHAAAQLEIELDALLPPVEGAPLDGYCAICYHQLDACRHCDGLAAPVVTQEGE
jgi:hypothetical protein